MPDEVIVFDVWGRYAHFKKIYVTTSALTYSVPFKTSVYGLVGAILGLDNRGNVYLDHFQEGTCEIGIQVINPIRIQRINTNLSPQPGPIKDNRKPTMMEYVTDPHYRIFFRHRDQSLFEELNERLKRKFCVYTPVLGLANCLANFQWKGLGKLTEKKGDALLHTVIPKDQMEGFDQQYWLDNEVRLQEQDMYPLEMNKDREVTKRGSILFDLNGKPVKGISTGHYRLDWNDQKLDIQLM